MNTKDPIEKAQEVMKLIPHRYPFLLVDRILEYNSEKLIAIKNVTINEPFFVGHFPGQPIMPGVLIIEALAQVAGVLGFKSQEKKPKDGYLYYFVGADEVRLRRPVVPGDQLMLKATIITNRRGLYRFSAKASVGDELVGTMNILCAERKIDVD